MSWRTLLGLSLIFFSYNCKTSDAGADASQAGEDMKKAVKEVVDEKIKPNLPLTAPEVDPPSVSYMQWKIDRMSFDKDSNEVRNKEGYVLCDVTNLAIRKNLNVETDQKVKDALLLLEKNKGKFSQKLFFVGYTKSRELVSVLGSEFLIESSFSHGETLTESDPAKKDAFDSALDLVLTVARDERICPKLKTLPQ